MTAQAQKTAQHGTLYPALEALYREKNRRCYVNPDPLHCVYRYAEPQDREIAGLIAAGLAYGRVAQIMRNVELVLDMLNPSPRAWLAGHTEDDIRSSFQTFKHRWTTGADLSNLLVGIQRALDTYGTLEALYTRHQSRHETTTVPALIGFCNKLRNGTANSLLPDPAKNASCKRLHLYLRWMVRRDDVDLGCWTSVDRKRLVIPLDTHMHQIARRLHLTSRKQADLRTALEVTEAFRAINPGDPAKYDFVLTRFGIRRELTLQALDSAIG